jgi:type VI secretion system secreted protein VgrG
MPRVFIREGGWSDNAADHGKQTNMGITIGTLTRHHPGASLEDLKNLTTDEATAIYRSDYWDPIHGDAIQDQVVAEKVFDLAINMGVDHAVRILQLALAQLGRLVMVDGVMGTATLQATGLETSEVLMPAIRQEAARRYISIVKADPTQRTFLLGWLIRALDMEA